MASQHKKNKSKNRAFQNADGQDGRSKGLYAYGKRLRAKLNKER